MNHQISYPRSVKSIYVSIICHSGEVKQDFVFLLPGNLYPQQFEPNFQPFDQENDENLDT